MYKIPQRIFIIILFCLACTGLSTTLEAESIKDNELTPADTFGAAEIAIALPENADTICDEAGDDEEAVEAKIHEHGKATYYSRKWHGRRTSSGRKLDNNGYQCAHKTLPFGTKIKVTNKKNGKSCVVEVVDRGPFAKGMVIDLTYQAARHIDMVNCGVVPVSLEIMEPGTAVSNNENQELAAK